MYPSASGSVFIERLDVSLSLHLPFPSSNFLCHVLFLLFKVFLFSFLLLLLPLFPVINWCPFLPLHLLVASLFSFLLCFAFSVFMFTKTVLYSPARIFPFILVSPSFFVPHMFFSFWRMFWALFSLSLSLFLTLSLPLHDFFECTSLWTHLCLSVHIRSCEWFCYFVTVNFYCLNMNSHSYRPRRENEQGKIIEKSFCFLFLDSIDCSCPLVSLTFCGSCFLFLL